MCDVGYLCAVFLGLYVLDLGPMYVTDRQDVRRASSLNAPYVGAGHNNNHNDIYSAVIKTEVIARVHSVHLVNVEQRQEAADPQTKPSMTCLITILMMHILHNVYRIDHYTCRTISY